MCARRLKPGGLLCTWAPTPRVYATFASVLPHVIGFGDREVLINFEGLPVRAMLDVTPDRLAEIFPVEADLAKRQARVAELDLRFRDQVIARLQ